MPDYNTYVGARYVPLIMGQWDNTKAYEPLSIVLNSGNSYTSRQYVPIGAALTDTDYWVMTGSFDGNVAALQIQVNANTAAIDDLGNEIEEVRSELIENGVKRKFIFISDSYGLNPTPAESWTTRMPIQANLAASDYYTASQSGGRFGWVAGEGGVNYLTILQTLEADIDANDDAENITDIIVGGGYNDANRSIDANLSTGIDAFCAYCRTRYPNSKVYAFWMGLCTDTTVYHKAMTTTINIYNNAQRRNWNFMLVPNSQYAFHRYDFLQADGIHPTVDGSRRLAQIVSTWIFTHTVPLNLDTDASNETWVSSGPYTGPATINPVVFDYGNLIYLSLPNNISIQNINANIYNQLTEIATITNPVYIVGSRSAYNILTCNALVDTNITGSGPAQWVQAPVQINLRQGKVYMNVGLNATINQVYIFNMIALVPKIFS